MRQRHHYILKIMAYIFSFRGRKDKNEKEPLSSPRRILLVKTHAIGDTIMTTPAIRAVRHRFPRAHISLLTGRLSREVMEGNPDINEILFFDESVLFKPDLAGLLNLIKMVRKKRFHMAVIFQYSPLIHLLVFAFGISWRVGFDNDGSGFSLTQKVPWDKKGERWTSDVHLDLVKSVGAVTNDKRLVVRVSEEHEQFANHFLKDYGVGGCDILIGIFCGGGKNSRDTVFQKRWSIGKYARIMEALSARNKVKMIVFGSQGDVEVISKLAGLSKAAFINAGGKLNLKQLAAVIKRCAVFITNDSAPLHIAIAVDTPSVSLFGPSRARAIVPKSKKHIAIQSSYPCSPCYSNSVFPGCDQPRCMDAIGCEEVLSAVARQLNASAGAS